jgi:hypothetical protein
VSCGNLLNFLYTNTSQKVVPNPPASIQAPIDQDISKYQTILDEVDVELQSSLQYIRRVLREKQEKEAKEAPKVEQKDDDIDLAGKATQENEGHDDTLESDDLFGESSFEVKEEPNGEGPDGDERLGKLNDTFDKGDIKQGFDDMPEASMDVFDNDLNALLSSVDNQGEGGQDDDMGGLFGDNFDFIIPTDGDQPM